MLDCKIVPLSGASLNSLFAELTDFEAQLKPLFSDIPEEVGGGAL
jgi:hypothetical protein